MTPASRPRTGSADDLHTQLMAQIRERDTRVREALAAGESTAPHPRTDPRKEGRVNDIVHRLTREEARTLTEEIKQSAEHTYTLLLRAHEGEAWAALDYDSWRDYATTEFNMSQSRAYQLLDQARIVRSIEAASDSTNVELPNEGQARELSRVPEPERLEVWRETVERTGGQPTAAAVRETYTARAEEVIDAELVDEPDPRTYTAPPTPARAPDRQPRVDVSRTVLSALTELRQARESLEALAAGRLAREDEETRRIWAARLNTELEALHGFHDSLIKEISQ